MAHHRCSNCANLDDQRVIRTLQAAAAPHTCLGKSPLNEVGPADEDSTLQHLALL